MPEPDVPDKTRAWPDTVVELLERQDVLVTELSALADQQTRLVEQGGTDALLGLLTRRQQIIERFAATQEALADLTDDLETRLASIDGERRGRIRALIGTIGERLATVMQRDERDQESLESARHTRSAELSTLGTARQARQAYRSAAPPGARFADQQG